MLDIVAEARPYSKRFLVVSNYRGICCRVGDGSQNPASLLAPVANPTVLELTVYPVNNFFERPQVRNI